MNRATRRPPVHSPAAKKETASSHHAAPESNSPVPHPLAAPTPRTLLQLQKTAGNRAVLQWVERDTPPHNAPAPRTAWNTLQRKFALRSAPPANEKFPIQGLFKQISGWDPLNKNHQLAYYIDLDTNKRYNYVDKGPGDGVVPYFWIAPVDNSHPPIAVIPVGDTDNSWKAIDENYRRELDERIAQRDPTARQQLNSSNSSISPNQSPPPITNTPNITTTTSQQTMEMDDLDTPGSFQQGSFQPFMLEEGENELRRSASIASLVTGFTVQPTLIPYKQGERSHYEKLQLQEDRYNANQIWVADIQVSNERMNTQFGKAQKRHTVAFTLSRYATMRLGNRPLSEILVHLKSNILEIAPFINSTEIQFDKKNRKSLVDNQAGPLLLNAVTTSGILDTILTGKLPVDRWQALLSNLLRIYHQLYEISTIATYKFGASKGVKEDIARNNLDEDNQRAKQKKKLRAAYLMAADAEKLFDVRMDANTIPPPQFAFIINHWIDHLKVTFPYLMAKAGEDVVGPFLEKDISNSYSTYIKKEQSSQQQNSKKKQAPPKITTVSELLEYYKYDPDTVDQVKKQYKPLLITGGFVLPSIELGQLRSDYTANISVAPFRTGNSQQFKTGFSNTSGISLSLDTYESHQVLLHSVALGNKERPKTKFISSQKSHTVAWTLVRHQLLGFQGRNVFVLLDTLADNLSLLENEITHKDGKKIAKSALKLAQQYMNKSLPVHEWQTLLSSLVRWYMIAYSSAETASYEAPGKGRGEGAAMRLLRRNEYSLKSGENLQDAPEAVINAAITLFDANVTSELSREQIAQAYEHWNTALWDAFPSLMSQGFKLIQQGMRDHKILDKQKKKEILMSEILDI